MDVSNYEKITMDKRENGLYTYMQDRQENFWAPGKKKTPILQIMILKLSPPQCVISNESVQQKRIDELWFRKQLSTCLFVWTLNYNDLYIY